jgi:membrane-associated phospholipid phosphatase
LRAAVNDAPPTAAYKPLAAFIRPETEQFKDQLEYLHSYADLRADRAAEIIAQLAISEPFFRSITSLQAERTPRSWELALTALRLAYYVVMRVKHGLACRRPHEYSSQIQPMIPVALHGTLPSGHATEAFTFAYVLLALLRDSGRKDLWGEQLMRQASRIAVNRTVAGVHFPVDSVAGAMLGLTLGQYLVARCKAASLYASWKFDGTKFKGDFNWRAMFDVGSGQKEAKTEGAIPSTYIESTGTQTLVPEDHSAVLNWLWVEASKEWVPQPPS